jgi:hypothetical protein
MTLDAEVASATADSYLTVAAADALAAADVGPETTAWAAATTDEKERALKRATREIDAYLTTRWPPYDRTTQALSERVFPRAIDYTGSPAVPYIPRNIKLATYEQATYVHANNATIDRGAARRASGRSSASEPNTSYTEAPDAAAAVMSPAALHYLAAFAVSASSRAVRTTRMGTGAYPVEVW